MTAFLRDHGLTLLLILAGIGTVSGWTRASHHRGVAEAEAAAVERLTVDLKAQADSATAARARALTATREAEETREHYQVTLARLNERIRDLSASHDSLEAAAEAELLAHDGWLSRETHEAVVDNLERSLVYTDSLRMEAEDMARTERERGDALQVQVGALMAQVGTLETVVQTQDRQIIALEAAQRSGGILPDLGSLTRPLYVAVGAVGGYLIAEASR